MNINERHQYQSAYLEALKCFQKQIPQKIVDLSLATFENDSFCLPYIGDVVTVNFPSGEMYSQKRPLILEDKIIILQYLTEATPAKEQNNWISFLQLPGGPLHHDPFVKVAQGAFERTFGNDKASFLKIADSYNAKNIKLSTDGLLFRCLPKIPAVVLLWEADDEFPAKCNILFDSTASMHLQTATIFMLGLRLAHIVCGSKRTT